MAQDKDTENASSVLSFILIGIGVGGLVYLGIRYFAGAAKTSVAGVSSAIASSFGASSGSGLGGNRPPPAPSSLVTFLTGNSAARKVFLFQAGMFSFYQSDALPDGKVGPVTHDMIVSINRRIDPMNSGRDFNDDVLRKLGTILSSLPLDREPRLLPFVLPGELIVQINNEGRVIASNIPLLQVMPS